MSRVRFNAVPAAALMLLALVLATTANADTQKQYFDYVDQDSDGFVSLVEFQDWMSRAFHQMDGNGDGVLEPAEQLIPNARRLTLADLHQRLAQQFARQDGNRDGRLSPREYLAPPQ